MIPWTLRQEGPSYTGTLGLTERTVEPQLNSEAQQAREQSGHHRYPSRRFLLPESTPRGHTSRVQLGWLSSDPVMSSELQLIQDSPGGTLKVTALGSVLWQQPVTQVVAQALLSGCEQRLDVHRWLYQPGDLQEPGPHLGRWRVSHYPDIQLLTARLEGPNPEKLPPGLETEVTGDGRYRPAWLARHGRPDPAARAEWRQIESPEGALALDLVETGPGGERRLSREELTWHRL